MTPAELHEITDWFARHHKDRCSCPDGPPDWWAIAVRRLLDEVTRLHERVRKLTEQLEAEGR